MKRLPRDKKDSNSPREFSLVRNPAEVIVRQPRDRRSRDRRMRNYFGALLDSEIYRVYKVLGGRGRSLRLARVPIDSAFKFG